MWALVHYVRSLGEFEGGFGLNAHSVVEAAAHGDGDAHEAAPTHGEEHGALPNSTVDQGAQTH
jgi:hypothetical protein